MVRSIEGAPESALNKHRSGTIQPLSRHRLTFAGVGPSEYFGLSNQGNLVSLKLLLELVPLLLDTFRKRALGNLLPLLSEHEPKHAENDQSWTG